MINTEKPARCLSVLGTGSNVGKSITVTALARIYKNRGVKVAPYKAQNMSNNSFVTREGREMGRAQVVQAEAAGVTPHVDMNPVLLKPCTDTGSQVVLQGEVIGNREARVYFEDNRPLFKAALESLQRLRGAHELVIIEGAGSCAEVNLRDRDFVNFETAHAVDAPVILVTDIDRGGVFAQIIGTLAVLSEEDRRRIKGFIINRFRGDLSLFDDGIAYLEQKTGLPVLGVIPYYRHIDIDSEDGLPLEAILDPKGLIQDDHIHIGVLRLPHISNFTDFAPLCREPDVTLHYLSKPVDLGPYDAVMLPGTKNVRFDIDWLKQTGWIPPITDYVKNEGRVMGICGGYQILGRRICDPAGVEGPPGDSEGIGLLNVTTRMAEIKQLFQVAGKLRDLDIPITGYEIHMGTTRRDPGTAPLLTITTRNGRPCEQPDGAVTRNGRIQGTYVHGIFDDEPFRAHFLRGIHPHRRSPSEVAAAEKFKSDQYDQLAVHFEEHLNMETLDRIVGLAAP